LHISKHNYAIEIANQNNIVYFLNPPNENNQVKDYLITEIDGYKNLYLINYKLITHRVIDFLRFRVRLTQFYDFLLLRLIKKISKHNSIKFEQIWNFDPNLHGYFHMYPASKKIFFIADQIFNNSQTRAAKRADIVVSVAEEILSKFRIINKNCLLINHGLNRSYEAFALKNLEKLSLIKFGSNEKIKKRIQVGYIGNLVMPFLDENILEKIVTKNQNMDFHFWGANDSKNNNLLSDFDSKIYNIVQSIKNNCHNAFFYGVKKADEIVDELSKIDMFIYINNPYKDINGGANSHKILEYLSTGKVIVSTYLSFYEKQKLLVMCMKGKEEEYSTLFKQTINSINNENDIEKQRHRIAFALENTYAKNIKKITAKISN